MFSRLLLELNWQQQERGGGGTAQACKKKTTTKKQDKQTKKTQNKLFSPDSLQLISVLLLFTDLDMQYFRFFTKKLGLTAPSLF